MEPERRLKGRNGWGRLRSPPQNQTRRSLTYCGRKMVLTTGTTFQVLQTREAFTMQLGISHRLFAASSDSLAKIEVALIFPADDSLWVSTRMRILFHKFPHTAFSSIYR